MDNSYVQALLDGGPILLISELGFLYFFVRIALKKQVTETWPILASWLVVVAVSFMGLAYFWDIKVWVFAGLILSATPLVSNMTSSPIDASQKPNSKNGRA